MQIVHVLSSGTAHARSLLVFCFRHLQVHRPHIHTCRFTSHESGVRSAHPNGPARVLRCLPACTSIGPWSFRRAVFCFRRLTAQVVLLCTWPRIRAGRWCASGTSPTIRSRSHSRIATAPRLCITLPCRARRGACAGRLATYLRICCPASHPLHDVLTLPPVERQIDTELDWSVGGWQASGICCVLLWRRELARHGTARRGRWLVLAGYSSR